jgi:WD40 repeat protein
VALLTPRERPLEELALALRRAAAPFPLPYSTAQMVDQFNHSSESLHYLAREILQAVPGDGSKPVPRFVVIVDQLEEIFTLTQSQPERRQFISLLLRAVEMGGGPVTVILAMRSDFIGKCAPYRDLNIYCSEHLEQVEPMTRVELQSAIESPAHSVGLEFEEGLVGVMLEDVKGSNSELPLIGHALWELFHYQPRPGNRLTAQAYEAIGRIEGALARRAETLYNGLIVSLQETLRKMFLLGLIQPGEGVPDTRRRALKEELLAIGGDAEAAEKLIYELATTRLLTVGRDEAAGQDTVEVAHEALIRNWGRIGEWMAEGREMARQRGILRQAAKEWEKSEKNPEYLFHGTRLAQMEEFVTAHGQDLGTLEKEFIAAGTAAREAQRRKKRRNTRAFIGALMVVLLVVIYFAYQADRNEKKALHQLAVNYWDTAQRMRKNKDNFKSLHLFCEALTIENNKRFREVLLTDMNALWRTQPLLHLFTHKDRINGARFSKDGSRILTWSLYNPARLWDASTGKPIGSVMEHEEPVNGAIFNKNDTQILTWSDDGTARLWDAASGKSIGQVMQHDDEVWGAVFNRDETRILTWSYDNTARLWDAVTCKPIGKVMEHNGAAVWEATFNKNETRILTWSKYFAFEENDTIRLWEAGTGKPIGEIIKYESPLYTMDIELEEKKPPDLTFTWRYDSIIRLWEAATGKPTGDFWKNVAWMKGAIFNKDGSRILTWGDNGTARLWDAATGKPFGEVIRHDDEVLGAIFNPDDTRILTWSDDGTARLWDATTGKPFGEVMKHEEPVKGAIFRKDGTHILTWSADRTARLWDAATGKPFGEVMKNEYSVNGAIFDTNETRVLTWTGDIYLENGTACLWDASSGKPIGVVMKHDGAVNGAIFNRNETRILTWSDDYTALLWDTATGTPIGEIMGHDGKVKGAVFNRDNTRILTWCDDGTTKLWDGSTGKPIVEYNRFNGYYRGDYLKKKETIIVKSDSFICAQFWDTKTGKIIGEIIDDNFGSKLRRFSISNKDETCTLSFGDDGTAELIDNVSGKPFGEIMRHDGPVLGAIFNKDETRILTWSSDGTARLWDATGKPIGEIMRHDGDLSGAVFNKNETLILTWDGTARLWDADTGKPIGEVMQHYELVIGAIFNKDETHIYTWIGEYLEDEVQSWYIAIDPDFPMEYIKLQAQAITGTYYDTKTNTVMVIPPDDLWEIKEQYMEIASRHYKSCRFPEGNVFRKLFPREAWKVRPEGK